MTEQELIEDMRQDMLVDMHHEKVMRMDLEYACDHLGIGTIYGQLEELLEQLAKYDHSLSMDELLDYIKEM